jgi:UDP-N-acetylmuramoylalanine--D-glutamate ligase
MRENNIDVCMKHPVAIFGSAVTGIGVMRFLNARGCEGVYYDRSGKNDAHVEFTEADAKWHRLVVYSQGFGPEHEWLALAREHGVLCLSELDFASIFWPGKIWAVTGTNGKSTLVTLLSQALCALGMDARAVGNIGNVFTEAVLEHPTSETIAVCEVSSFQAEAMELMCPDLVAFTTLSANHMDRHGTFKNYFLAKAKLIERCKTLDIFVGETVAAFSRMVGYALRDGVEVVNANEQLPFELTERSPFFRGPQQLNIRLAVRIFKRMGYSLEILRGVAEAFKLLPHRLQRVRMVNGVEYWNDSKSTTLESTLAALSTFNKGIYWIGGGVSKGEDVEHLARHIGPRIKEAFVIGATGPQLVQALGGMGIRVQMCDSLSTAIRNAAERACPNSIVLLSPAFASWDQFENYGHRGKSFEEIVLGLM